MKEGPSEPFPFSTGDPVADLILRGEASTVAETEERYLDSHLDEVLRLAGSSLSDEEFRRLYKRGAMEADRRDKLRASGEVDGAQA